MNKIFTLISVLTLSALLATAQNSLQSQYPTTTVLGLPSDQYLSTTCQIYNVSANSLDVMLERTDISVLPGTENTFCWGLNCYPPQVTLSPNPATIAGGATESSFVGDFYPYGTAGLNTVQYRFFDSNNSNDAVTIVVNYDTSPLGIHSASAASNSLNVGYNPNGNLMAISYNLKNLQSAHINIIDMLGKTLKTFPVNSTSGNIIFSTEGMSSGVYFVSLVSANK